MPERDNLDADVLIAGGGAVGLWLAAELRLGGASVTVLEKREARSQHSRAHTLHARTLELFASRGLAGPWLAEGIEIPTTHYAMLSSRLDLTGLDSEFPFVLFLPQVRTEELLEQHALAAGVRLLRGREVGKVAVDPGGQRVRVLTASPDGQEHEYAGRFLVGCDGRRSVVRAAAGIGYTGTEDMLTCVIGDVELADPDVPPAMTRHAEGGSFYAVRLDPARYRLIGLEHATMSTPRDKPLGLDEFRAVIERLTGQDFGIRNPSWLTRVGSATFQADHYRQGPILLAGDAAHVHFPMGGQGLNLGLQDAMNLGWKLAAVVRSAAPSALLDTYEQERAPVGRAVIDDTLAQTGLVAVPGREGYALREMLTGVLAQDKALNARLGTFASGIGVTYPPPPGAHPLVGQRVPNLRLTGGGDVFTLLQAGRFAVAGLPPDVLSGRLTAAAGPAGETSAWLSVADSGLAPGHRPWDEVGAALIRPDGHLAWAEVPGADPQRAVAGALAGLHRWLPGLSR